MVKQLLPLWYMELSDEERGSLCSPDQMVNVGGVQIPKWFWERAGLEAETSDCDKCVGRALLIAGMLAKGLDKFPFLWKGVCGELDEAFMSLYADLVKNQGLEHDEAYASAGATLGMIADNDTTGVLPPAVALYVELREKADADA